MSSSFLHHLLQATAALCVTPFHALFVSLSVMKRRRLDSGVWIFLLAKTTTYHAKKLGKQRCLLLVLDCYREAIVRPFIGPYRAKNLSAGRVEIKALFSTDVVEEIVRPFISRLLNRANNLSAGAS